ncbi:hypothetical protein, partial [Arthrobacter sp.]|uniref:hypothetical protein n=1 Tax=Arthrobacter sp. TaxID=1667 RepID=UPI002811BEA9
MSGNVPGGNPEDRPWQSPSGQPQWGQNQQQPQWGQNQQQPQWGQQPGWPVPPPGHFHGYQAPPK